MFSSLEDLIDLPKIVLPYLSSPFTLAEIFFPHTWLVSWLSAAPEFSPLKNIPSLDGKVILVTGGNTGLGEETILQLLLHRPRKIYLAARSADKAQAAIERLWHKAKQAGQTAASTILWLKLDLADFRSVQAAAHEVLYNENRLDIVVLNAGIMACPRSKSMSGHDLQFATNYMGHFLLVHLLLPLLEKTAATSNEADVRIVTLSSEALNIAPRNFLNMVEHHDRLCASSNYMRYGISKAANVLFAAELARRHSSKSILSVSCHPGVILTKLYTQSRDSNVFVHYGLPLVARLLFDDVKHGAFNTLWCTSARPSEICNGKYYTPVGRCRDLTLVNDEEQAVRLWSWTQEELRDFL